MVYIRVKISDDKELLANPNCPIKILYNFIQAALVEANSKPLVSATSEEGCLTERLLANGSIITLNTSSTRSKSLSRRFSKSSTGSKEFQIRSKERVTVTLSKVHSSGSKTSNRSIREASPTLSGSCTFQLPNTIMPADQEFDICDENGILKQIYDVKPWVNGLEAGIFTNRTTYIAVIFERDEEGTIIKQVPMVPRASRQYSELLLKIRRSTSTPNTGNINSKIKVLGEQDLSTRKFSK